MAADLPEPDVDAMAGEPAGAAQAVQRLGQVDGLAGRDLGGDEVAGERQHAVVDVVEGDLGVAAVLVVEPDTAVLEGDVGAVPAAVVAETIGSAHVLTPVTNTHLVCRLLLEKNRLYLNKGRAYVLN